MFLASPWLNDINGHATSHLINLLSHSCSHFVDRWLAMLVSKNYDPIGFWMKFTQSKWYNRHLFHENWRMPQGTWLTELEQGKILAYKDSGTSTIQVSKKNSRSGKVMSDCLRDPNCYVCKKKCGIQRKISETAKRRLLCAASNQITSASKLKRSMVLNISVGRVQQVLQAAPDLWYRKMRAVPWMTERHFADRVDAVKHHISWNYEWRNATFRGEK